MNIDRVNSTIKRELAELISNEINDIRLTRAALVSVVRVQTTLDLKYAKVFISIMPSDNKKEIIDALTNSAGFLRNALFSRLKIRAVPLLTFIHDDSTDYSIKIESILKEINNPKTN
jgi:ribosome-binding factor A